MDLQGTDTLIAAAIGALAAIFVGAFVALLFICRRQYKRKNWDRDIQPFSSSIKSKTKKKRADPELAMALRDIGLGSALDQIMNDELWVDDHWGLLIPQCLAVLRACRSLTEKLATMAMGPGIRAPADRVIEGAKRIPSRVDDVVQAMNPPLDPRLLEARCAALVLAVGQLALLTQNSGSSNKSWIEQSLQNMDDNLTVLRKAALELDDPKLSSRV